MWFYKLSTWIISHFGQCLDVLKEQLIPKKKSPNILNNLHIKVQLKYSRTLTHQIQTSVDTLPHTHSNQQSRDRHLTPADIPPQDERRFFTAVTLSKHQDETVGDGRAGSETI